MSRSTHLCFFGGFRQDAIPDGKNAYRELVNTSEEKIPFLNLWNGPGDTLASRWQRCQGHVEKIAIGDPWVILGYSMGCHLAIRFAEKLLGEKRFNPNKCSMYLLAPDPKYKRGAWDLMDNLKGGMSAYDEAVLLWNAKDSPGMSFEKVLGKISQRDRGFEIHVAYCKDDTVAEWTKNVEILSGNLNQGIKWVEIKYSPSVDCGKLPIKIDPKLADREDWVHYQIFAWAKT